MLRATSCLQKEESGMLSREEVIAKAVECGFEDTGFTTAEPFDAQRAILEERRE